MPAATPARATVGTLSAPHIGWAAGHAVVVLSTLYTLFRLATFSAPSRAVYSIAYAGALISWGVVVFKTQGIPSLDKAYLNRFAPLLCRAFEGLTLALRFLTDENGECESPGSGLETR
jgi:hypothetical protein